MFWSFELIERKADKVNYIVDAYWCRESVTKFMLSVLNSSREIYVWLAIVFLYVSTFGCLIKTSLLYMTN